MSFGSTNAFLSSNAGSDNGEIDFERLVKGNTATALSVDAIGGDWDSATANAQPGRPNSTQSKPGKSLTTQFLVIYSSRYVLSLWRSVSWTSSC
jgi:hypothetical protein